MGAVIRLGSGCDEVEDEKQRAHHQPAELHHDFALPGIEMFLLLMENGGTNLKTLMAQWSPHESIDARLERVLGYTRQLRSGLANLHAAGLAHGDMKLANIVVNEG